MSDKLSYTIPTKPSAKDLHAAIACWEAGGSVTGGYATALYRYWKGLGPEITSQQATDDFAFISHAFHTELTERCSRLEAALAAAATALDLDDEGQETMSAEELVERLLYPEHFNFAALMSNKRAWERIEIARTQ